MAKKEKVKTARFRKPYYELSDAIYGFESATAAGTDVKLKSLAKKMIELQNDIQKHLEANYIWD
jgi:uncharacterized protein YdcH (DUF465 family)